MKSFSSASSAAAISSASELLPSSSSLLDSLLDSLAASSSSSLRLWPLEDTETKPTNQESRHLTACNTDHRSWSKRIKLGLRTHVFSAPDKKEKHLLSRGQTTAPTVVNRCCFVPAVGAKCC